MKMFTHKHTRVCVCVCVCVCVDLPPQKGQGKPGQTVLVHGGSGGTGIATIQLAVAAGLKVRLPCLDRTRHKQPS
jgi:NADPH:quinone reductase-like Zn-dependent oxidoreductase